jgi:fibronectin-binding autotransporter adhesin
MMATKTWNGSNADWFTAADWTGGTVPTSGHDVIISSGDPFLQSGDPAATAASITLSGALDVDTGGSNGGSSLTIGGTLANTGAVQIGPNNFTLSAPTTLTLGGLTNSTGASFVLYGSASHAATVNVNGNATSSGSLDIGAFADLIIAGGTGNIGDVTNNGAIEATSGATITVTGAITGTGQFEIAAGSRSSSVAPPARR